MKDKTIYIRCDCGAELLQVISDKDDKCLYVCYFKLGHYEPASWGYRLRTIWKVFTTGTPYGDEVVLTYKEAQKLAKFIQEETK